MVSGRGWGAARTAADAGNFGNALVAGDEGGNGRMR